MARLLGSPGSKLQTARLRAGLSRGEVARRAGCSESHVTKLERGERTLDAEWIKRLAPIVGVKPSALLPDEFHEEAAEYIAPAVRPEVIDLGAVPAINLGRDNFLAIPVFDIRVAAGPGAMNGDREEPVHHAFFRSEFLRRVSSASPQHLAVVRVAGDSMATTLHDGDHVLIDRTARAASRDGIYVLRIGDDLVVKRVAVHPATRKLSIRSDNPAYPAFENIDPAEVSVIGRAIWIGRHIGG